MEEKVIIAGFGGQGIMLAGKLLNHAGLILERYVTYIPSYGAEVRGGTAHCHVVISEEEIASPIISQPDACLVMNSPSLLKFSGRVRSGGFLLINSSLVKEDADRKDLTAVKVPANRKAQELGSIKASNMVMLGAYLRHSRLLTLDALKKALKQSLPARHRDLLEINLQALQDGYELA